MRILSRMAGWAICACLLTAASPVPDTYAQPAKVKTKKKTKAKSVRRCMKFRQSMGEGESSVDFSLTSTCKISVVCQLEWDLQCSSGDEDEAETISSSKKTTTLDFSDTWEVNASASSCDLDWEINNVRWHCTPAE